LLGVLAHYLQQEDTAESPERQFQRAAAEAEAMVAELTRRARRRSRARSWLVGFLLRRARALGGLREMPRFCLALLLADLRALLQPIGVEFAQRGQLEAADDIFFLTLPDLDSGLRGMDLRARACERRAHVAQERMRRRVPLVLLSDGTTPTAESDLPTSTNLTLRGIPAAPGRITALARVVLDPHDNGLARGEILVASATDSGWTPLFVTAGGLVMEFGGAMAHGAIVAREYGLPAVVGVGGATERIRTGSRITLDGTAGTVTIESAADS
jgi:pyruvate,water dikinase